MAGEPIGRTLASGIRRREIDIGGEAPTTKLFLGTAAVPALGSLATGQARIVCAACRVQEVRLRPPL
jgi:hypothetical protein